MLFEINRCFPKIAAREMTPQSLEQRQRDVYDSHRHRVFSLSYYMTGNEIEAEEILRDTFVAAFRRADEPDHAIVDTALLEQLKEWGVLRDDDQLPAPLASLLPQRQNILRTDLEEAIRCLPSTERLVFLLMDVEGYPVQRIGELLRISDSAVLRTALTARLRLREELAALQEAARQEKDQEAA